MDIEIHLLEEPGEQPVIMLGFVQNQSRSQFLISKESALELAASLVSAHNEAEKAAGETAPVLHLCGLCGEQREKPCLSLSGD